MNWPLDRTLLLYLFPLFGLAAFSLLWLHAISGVFEPWLRRNFNFDRFVHAIATIVWTYGIKRLLNQTTI